MADVEDPDPSFGEHAGDDDDETTPLIHAGSCPSRSGGDIGLQDLGGRKTTPHEQGEAETSFIEGGSAEVSYKDEKTGKKVVIDNERIIAAWRLIRSKYPRPDPQVLSHFRVVETPDGAGKVVVGPRGGSTPLFVKDGRINPALPKTTLKLLGKTEEEISREINQLVRELEEIAQDELVVNDDDAGDDAREAARERIENRRERLAGLEAEQERLEQRLSLRERIKAIFKKYGFMLTAVALAVGTTIGVIISALTRGLKSVARGVGNGLKDLGKKVAGLLPGLLGSIVGFVLRTAGEVVKFLGENAWLLILAVAAFMIDRGVKRDG